MSICRGSCVGGPAARHAAAAPLESRTRVEDHASPLDGETGDFQGTLPQDMTCQFPPRPVEEDVPGEKQLREIL